MLIDKFRKTQTSYIIRVLVNPDEVDKDKHIYEQFEWGLDVPVGTIKLETKRLLLAKYNTKSTLVSGEGKPL